MTDNTPAVQEDSYRAADIAVNEGLAHVRTRPAMYIGDTGKKGLHHLVWEVMDNSVDEAMARDASGKPYCTTITVIVDKDGETISVEDNGRGIPVDIHPKYVAEQKTALEVILTVLGAGGKFEGKGYKTSGGLHGVGTKCVNALSDRFTARVWRDGGEFMQEFAYGIPQTKTVRVGDSRKHGTRITYHPDHTIFTGGIKVDEEVIINRLRETAFLNRGLTVKFINENTGTKETFCYEGGIADFVSYMNKGESESGRKRSVYPSAPIYFEAAQGDIEVEIALQYVEEEDSERINSYTNNIRTTEGGTHVSGFKTALTRVVNQFSRANGMIKDKAPNLSGDDIREGIAVVVSVRLPSKGLQFEGQTKSKLGNVEVEGIVNSLVGEKLTEHFEKNPATIQQIVKRALTAQEARAAAKQSAELIKRKSVLRATRLPGKLLDCNLEDRTCTELFIVEGDSALGSAKKGRDGEFQAIFPIRGKIINTEKSPFDALKNQEVQNLITVVGTGIDLGEDQNTFDYEARRYDKFIILCDADVDGSHITALLMAFFQRFLPKLVEKGHVYIATPPLYKIEYGKKKLFYTHSDEERDAILAKHGYTKDIGRFKGLGEMDGLELGDTTMNPANRKLYRLTNTDPDETLRMLRVLMGRDVVERKKHIVLRSHQRAEAAMVVA